MAPSNEHKSYHELAEHSAGQIIIFATLLLTSIVLVFLLMLPVFQEVFENLLTAKVYNSGETITYFANDPKPLLKTNYYFNWAVDVTIGANDISRYWVSPLLTLFLQSTLIGLILSILMTTLMPLRLGYMRQKIEREIANGLDKILIKNSGANQPESREEIINSLLNSSLSQLHQRSQEWQVSFEDIKTLSHGIKWRQSGLVYKIFHINDAIKVYMRFHFTVKFPNTILGLVYIGAAVLIIIIGLRGLKFIPPTQPSLVLFALGLEFSLLITYALTLMYSKQDEDTGADQEPAHNQDIFYMPGDFGSHRDVEKLLRVFIKPKKKP